VTWSLMSTLAAAAPPAFTVTVSSSPAYLAIRLLARELGLVVVAGDVRQDQAVRCRLVARRLGALVRPVTRRRCRRTVFLGRDGWLSLPGRSWATAGLSAVPDRGVDQEDQVWLAAELGVDQLLGSGGLGIRIVEANRP